MSNVILSFLLDRKQSLLFSVLYSTVQGLIVKTIHLILNTSWNQNVCTISCPWPKQLAPFDHSAKILICFSLLYSIVTIYLIYLPLSANSITSLNYWRRRTKLHLYDKVLKPMFMCSFHVHVFSFGLLSTGALWDSDQPIQLFSSFFCICLSVWSLVDFPKFICLFQTQLLVAVYPHSQLFKMHVRDEKCWCFNVCWIF